MVMSCSNFKLIAVYEAKHKEQDQRRF